MRTIDIDDWEARYEYEGLFDSVRAVVSLEEFRNLVVCYAKAVCPPGKTFVYDESSHFAGERSEAERLQGMARRVNLDALADRLDPCQFAPNEHEQFMDQIWANGRALGSSAPGPD